MPLYHVSGPHRPTRERISRIRVNEPVRIRTLRNPRVVRRRDALRGMNPVHDARSRGNGELVRKLVLRLGARDSHSDVRSREEPPDKRGPIGKRGTRMTRVRGTELSMKPGIQARQMRASGLQRTEHDNHDRAADNMSNRIRSRTARVRTNRFVSACRSAVSEQASRAVRVVVRRRHVRSRADVAHAHAQVLGEGTLHIRSRRTGEPDVRTHAEPLAYLSGEHIAPSGRTVLSDERTRIAETPERVPDSRAFGIHEIFRVRR